MTEPLRLCSCPDEPPYWGLSWKVDLQANTTTCNRCGGQIRPEQDRFLADEWNRGMRGPKPKPFTDESE